MTDQQQPIEYSSPLNDGFQITITGNVKGTLHIHYKDPQEQHEQHERHACMQQASIVQQRDARSKHRYRQSEVPVVATVAANAGASHECDETCGSVEKAVIEFEDPNQLLPREKKSKRLDNDSALVRHLACIRKKILARFPTAKGNDRPWHIELCSRFIDAETMVRKAQALQGTTIDLKDVGNYTFIGKEDRAFVLCTGIAEDYGMTHITIAFFVTPLTDDDRKWIMDLI